MSQCEENHCTCVGSMATQSLDEMEFERGIWYAAQYGDLDRVEKLLNSHDSDADKRDAAGYTALHYAARNGHLDVCKLLIRHGADINSVTKIGKASALCRASTTGKIDIVKYLLDKKANPHIQDSDGKTALHRAAENGHYEICRILLNVAPSLYEIADNRGNRVDLTKVN